MMRRCWWDGAGATVLVGRCWWDGAVRSTTGTLVVFARGRRVEACVSARRPVGAGGPELPSQGGGPTAAPGPGGAGNVPAPVTR